MLKIHNHIRTPDTHLEFLASDNLAGMFQKHSEDLERKRLQSYPAAVPVEFARSKIGLKQAESHTEGFFRDWQRF